MSNYGRIPDTKHFLPTTKKELEWLGWDYVDVVIISGDAYVDHPSFGPAVIGRWLERLGSGLWCRGRDRIFKAFTEY